jgi:hypothetical protein
VSCISPPIRIGHNVLIGGSPAKIIKVIPL